MLSGRRIRIAPNITLKLLPPSSQGGVQSSVGKCDAAHTRSQDISTRNIVSESAAVIDTKDDENLFCGDSQSIAVDSVACAASNGVAEVEGRRFGPQRSPLRIVLPPQPISNGFPEKDYTDSSSLRLPNPFVGDVALEVKSIPMTSPLRAGSLSLPSVQGPFRLLRLMQEGTFGDAWAAEDQSSGRVLCLKVFRPLDENGLKEGVRRELKAYKRIATSVTGTRGKLFVMELERSFQYHRTVSFAMELMSCDLSNYMFCNPEGCTRHTRRWLAQIALGIASLHEMGIIHRDIKAENILIDSRENVHITDFGLAYLSQRPLHSWGGYTSEVSGTPQCMAPEMLRNKYGTRKDYGIAVDWWALGCLFYELESPRHEPLFANEEEVFKFVAWHGRFCRVTRVHPKFKHLSDQALPVIEGLLRISPSLRYTLWDLERHPYFLRCNGKSEFIDAAARALERPVQLDLVSELRDVGETVLIPRAGRTMRFDKHTSQFICVMVQYMLPREDIFVRISNMRHIRPFNNNVCLRPDIIITKDNCGGIAVITTVNGSNGARTSERADLVYA